jgi:hypothetical protein
LSTDPKGKGDCVYEERHQGIFYIGGFKAFERMLIPDLEKLVCNSPVSVSLRVNQCLKDYQSGIIFDGDGSACGCSDLQLVNHSAVLVGFGIDQTITKPG